jgi:hypothetical protein
MTPIHRLLRLRAAGVVQRICRIGVRSSELPFRPGKVWAVQDADKLVPS